MNDKFTNNHEELDELLTQTAHETKPSQHFSAELEGKLRQAHGSKPRRGWLHFTRRQTVSALAWTAMLVVFALVLNWTIKSIAPAPTSVPAANESSTPSASATDTSGEVETQTTPVPEGESFDWRGTKLYLNAPLPETPPQSNIYLLKDGQPATVEQALALAEQLGIQGQVYVSENLITQTTEYLVTDGKQSLAMTTDRFFTYNADMSKPVYFLGNNDHPNAEAAISDFLRSHGFDFPHRVTKGDLFGGYMVEPLSPDGFQMRYEFFSSRPMRVTLDEGGQVLQIEANLMDYEPVSAQTYEILSAEEAFQRMLDDSVSAGKIESAVFAPTETKQWIREYPENETITIYGYASSVPALDPSQPAFIQIDGFTVTGNTGGMESLERNTFVEATGQFITENEIEKFNVESWQISGPIQEGLVGTLTSENGQVIFQTEEGDRLVIQPEIPADIPLPFENAFVVGVRRDETYNWTLIDNRISLGGGGGGGGGGLGFYKLNLSGTPVPFPPPQPTPGAGDGSYVVQAGDTLTSIADAFGVTVDELLQANGLTADSLIFVDQQLIIPGGGEQTQNPLVGKRFENQRGIVTISIYRQPDGNLREEYIFATKIEGQTHYLPLKGEDLQELKNNNNRPVNIWGSIEVAGASPVLSLSVERFEIPFPDLQFQILRGTQKVDFVENRSVVMFTTEDGTKYIELYSNGDISDLTRLGTGEEDILIEGLIIPDETFGGYPTIRVFGGSLAINPKNGEPVELTVTADQIHTVDEVVESQVEYTPPALIIEKVELMYFVTNPHWQADRLDGGPLYIQPVWRFYGHYENGGEFEVIVQALKEEYLLPELDTYVQGG